MATPFYDSFRDERSVSSDGPRAVTALVQSHPATSGTTSFGISLYDEKPNCA